MKILEGFLIKHFGTDVKFDCVSHAFQGPFQSKKLASSSFIMFFDQYTADEIFKHIKSDEDKYKRCSSTGEALQILKRKTPTEKRRDYCLGRAEEIWTEQAASLHAKPTIKIVWKERKVQVNGVDAFVQAKTDDRGSFCGTFVSFPWTDRQK